MHKLILSFLIVFIGTSILAAIMQGGGGIESTVLASSVNSTATYIPGDPDDMDRFAESDILQIGSEYMYYTSTDSGGFNIAERGYDDTTADAHDSGAVIYTQEAGVLNNALGYDVGVTLESSGSYAIIQVPLNFFTITLPHLVDLNANFLTQTPELEIIAIVWFGFGIALIITLAIWIAPIAVSLITGLFGLIRGVR